MDADRIRSREIIDAINRGERPGLVVGWKGALAILGAIVITGVGAWLLIIESFSVRR